MHSIVNGTDVRVWLVPGLIAGLIGLCVGMAGERGARASAVPAVHQDRAVMASGAAPSLPRPQGVTTPVEGRFCRPVWSAEDATSTEPAACKAVVTPPRLMSL